MVQLLGRCALNRSSIRVFSVMFITPNDKTIYCIVLYTRLDYVILYYTIQYNTIYFTIYILYNMLAEQSIQNYKTNYRKFTKLHQVAQCGNVVIIIIIIISFISGNLAHRTRRKKIDSQNRTNIKHTHTNTQKYRKKRIVEFSIQRYNTAIH